MIRNPPQTDAVFEPGRRWLASSLLSNDPRVKHASTTRRFAQGSVARADMVRQLNDTLGWGAAITCLAEQTHGDGVATIRAEELAGLDPGAVLERPEADALVTNAAGAVLAVFTADCAPIVFADARAGVIGAVHAGWKGTMAGALPRALQAAFQLGADPDRLRLWIAPTISGAEYEVSLDLAVEFAQRFPAWADHVVHGRKIDLVEINRLEALACGARPAHVAVSGLCVMKHPDDFYSYRREGQNAGRMATAIVRIA